MPGRTARDRPPRTRAATDTTRMTACTIAANAKRLERKPIVTARVEELRQGGESKKVEFPRNIAHAGAREKRSVSGAPSRRSPGPHPTKRRGEAPAQQPRPPGRPTVYAEELPP